MEFLLWILGILLTIWGISMVVSSPLFWGTLLIVAGVYIMIRASKIGEGGK